MPMRAELCTVTTAPDPTPAVPAAGPGRDEERTSRLVGALQRLREDLGTLRLPFDVAGVEGMRAERARLAAQLDDYLIPRLRSLEAPVVAVVGGATGAGKSTLVNSLVGREVTPAGVIRPTTRIPVLVHHPDDARWFADDVLLAGFRRVSGPGAAAEGLDPEHPAVLLVPDEHQPRGLAVIDAPDLDSVVAANRDLALRLLDAADLWLFTTTPSRYADAVPWSVLRRAVDHGTSVTVVLDRVAPDVLQDVRLDLARLLSRNGLDRSPIFTIPERTLTGGLLPENVVTPMRTWLAGLAGARRRAVVERTASGAVEALGNRVPALADAAHAQVLAGAVLRGAVFAVFDQAGPELGRSLADGSALGGGVVAAWRRFEATGVPPEASAPVLSRLRDRFSAAHRRGPAAEALGAAVTDSLATTVSLALRHAAAAVAGRWSTRPEGAALVAEAEAGATGAADTARDRVAGWYAGLDARVVRHARDRRTRERLTALGAPAAAGVLAFAASIDADEYVAPGAPDGPADEASVLPDVAAARRLLSSVFGEADAVTLVEEVRRELVAVATGALDELRTRYSRVVAERTLADDVPARLTGALEELEASRP